jgi:hypothetical protein
MDNRSLVRGKKIENSFTGSRWVFWFNLRTNDRLSKSAAIEDVRQYALN